MIARKIEESFELMNAMVIPQMKAEDSRRIIGEMNSTIRWARKIRIPTLEERYRNRPDLLAKIREKK